MSWMGTGYKTSEEIDAETPKGSDNKGPKRFWVKQGGEPQRIMFLDTTPNTAWEHNFRWDGHWRNHEPCHFKMQIGPHWEEGCPLCSYKRARGEKATVSWARYTGFYTVMQMTPWFTDKRQAEINYRRQLLAALRGSDENPGMFRVIQQLSEKHGRLKGLVFDVTRMKAKDESVGSTYELIEKVDEKDIEEYGHTKLKEYMERENANRPRDKKLTMEKLLKWNPWESFGDIGSIYEPRSRNQLLKMFDLSTHGGDDDGGGYDDDSSGSRDRGDGGGAFDDDDIPY